jgi:hypothetical protein
VDARAAGSDGLEHFVHKRQLLSGRLHPFRPDRVALDLPAARRRGRRRRHGPRLRRRACELVRRLARGTGEGPAMQQVRGYVEGRVPLLGLPFRRSERGPGRLALAAAATAAGGLCRSVALRRRGGLGLHGVAGAWLRFAHHFNRREQPEMGRRACRVYPLPLLPSLFSQLCSSPSAVLFRVNFWGRSVG